MNGDFDFEDPFAFILADFSTGMESQVTELERLLHYAEDSSSLALSLVTTGLLTIGSIVIPTLVGTAISSYYASIAGFLKTVAEKIHLSTIIAVNRILMFTSHDYREMMKGFYEGISEVSKVMGYSTYFLAMLFRNSRMLVMDSLTTMGVSYDESELVWLDRFDKFLVSFSNKAYSYVDDPEQLFFDIESQLESDLLTKKAGFISSLGITITGMISTIDSTIMDINLVKKDFERLVDDLPDEILKQIKTPLEDAFEAYDIFLREKYNPLFKRAEEGLNLLGMKIDKEVDNIFQITGRLLHPIDYLLEIDTMTDAEKADQEEKLNELITRRLGKEASDLVEVASPTFMDLKAVGEEGIVPTTIPPWSIPEIETPVTPAGETAAPRETWNVGDY